jgi:cell division protein FtsQ
MAARETKQSGGIRWRLWLGLGALGLLCVSTGMAALRAHRFVMADPQFMLSPERKDALAIEGLRYAARSRVQAVFAADFGRSIFTIPLAERRRRLLAIDWVEEASVSRIWPDRLRVRIRERKPVAFVSLPGGAMLIDAEGVLLEPPAQAQFAFPVLSGVREEETDDRRRERVKAMLAFEQEMGDHTKDISEIDASDPASLRVIARVQDRALELLMGDGGYAQRYRNFLNHYPEIQKRSPEVTTFDLRLDDRITARE